MAGASSLLFMAACAVVLLYSTSFSHGMPSTPPAPTTSTSAGVSAQTLLKVASSLKMYVDQLPTMPKLYGYKTQKGKLVPHALTIGMYAKKWKFHRDLPPTPVFVYGTSPTTATFPGPTIYARQGMELPITWKNFLPQKHILPWDTTIPTAIPKYGGVPTVVHLHGSVHPPKYDGSAFAWFTKDFKETGPFWSTTTYNYPNVQPPGNLWYHDHALGLTRVNILAGLLGAYVIQKPSIDDVLDLPKGAEYDRHLFICDRSFNKDGSIYMNHTGVYPPVHPQWRPEYLGEVVTVNGKAWPYLSVKSRKYRFRIINASNARFFNLSLSDGLPFYIIGSDASYLSAPVRATSVLLSTFEAADIIVDFSTTTRKSIELVNNAAHPFPKGPPSSPATTKVMRFIIQPMGETDPPDTSIVPREEVRYAKVKLIDVTAAKTRYMTMNEYFSPTRETTHLYMNGKRFEDPVTETPKTGSTEIWHIINPTGDNHPLHLHLGMFQAIRVQEIVNLKTFVDCMSKFNDAVKCNISGHSVGRVLPIPEHEKTWKNVVKIEPGYVTTILIKFKIVDTDMSYPFDATAEPGYVYHCHILDHEDNVMIRPLKLVL